MPLFQKKIVLLMRFLKQTPQKGPFGGQKRLIKQEKKGQAYQNTEIHIPLAGGNRPYPVSAVAGHGQHPCNAEMERKATVGMADWQGEGQGGNKEPPFGDAQPHCGLRHRHP